MLTTLLPYCLPFLANTGTFGGWHHGGIPKGLGQGDCGVQQLRPGQVQLEVEDWWYHFKPHVWLQGRVGKQKGAGHIIQIIESIQLLFISWGRVVPKKPSRLVFAMKLGRWWCNTFIRTNSSNQALVVSNMELSQKPLCIDWCLFNI